MSAWLLRTACCLGLLSTALLGATAHAIDMRGAVCGWGDDKCNKCVNDVVSAVNNLRDHGEVMGFFPLGDPVTLSNHWQGVQRLPFGGGRHLAISQSGPTKAFSVVEMGSRDGGGLRFRSNRLAPNQSYPATPPPSSDRVITDVWLPSSLPYTHQGGMQVVGHVLAVPLEDSTVGGAARVIFYDMANPTQPVLLPTSRIAMTEDAGTASVARLADGRFLLIIGRADANNLEVYLSTTADLRAPMNAFTLVDTWNEAELRSVITNDREFANYQNLNLVTQCDGSLFLVGTHLDSSTGWDWVDAHRVTAEGDNLVLTKVARRHLYCGYPSPGYDTGTNRHCNLDAAGGLYVDPHGQLLVYGTEHDNDGPAGSVKMMEFRPTFPNPGCESDINKAFVELYDDSDFTDRGLMIDYPDAGRENAASFSNTEGFNDKASSIRYCIPFGWRYRLYENSNYGGSYKQFGGRGSVNLHSVGFGDKGSSGRFIYLGY